MSLSHHDRRLRAPLGLLAAALLLGGCGSSDADDAGASEATSDGPSASPSEETGPQAATDRCYAEAGSDGPDYSTAVDCSEPHVGEVFGVLDVPADLPEERSLYVEDREAAARWADWGDDACAIALTSATGGDERNEVMGLPEGTVNVPDWEGTFSYSLVTEEEWDAGAHQTVCTARQNEDEPLAGEFVAGAVTEDRDPALAICAGYQDGASAFVDCDEPHYSELAFRYDAQALGEDFLADLDPADPTGAQYEEMDALCASTEELLLGQERDDLKVMSSLPGTFGEGGYSLVSCGVQPQDRTKDAVGSVLGIGDGELTVVPTQG